MSRSPADFSRRHPPVKVSRSLAHYPGALVAIGLLISVSAHVWLGVALYDMPIGYIDPALVHETREPIRVKRADFDYILDERGGGEGESSGSTIGDSLADLSRKLLQEKPPGLGEVELPADVALRAVEDAMAVARPIDLAIDLPAFELTDQALAAMTTGSPRELSFAEEDSGGGAGIGSSGVGGSAEARRILDETGLITGIDPRPRTPPGVGRDRPVLDTRLLDVPLDPAPIDFAHIALRDTTALDIPERLDTDFEYVLTRHQTRDFPQEPGYFKVDIAAQRSLHKLAAMPKDVIFLIDISGSIPGEWVEQIARGVRLSLPLLNEGDRFNIVMFADQPRFFDERSIQPATQANLQRAGEFLLQAQSGGATDVNAALSRLLVRDVNHERVYEVILVSDGKPTRGVIDTRQLINLITRDNDLRASIYCVAVGRDPNLELLNFLSYRNKGFTVTVGDFTAAAPRIQELMSRLRYPLIKDLRLAVAGQGVTEVHPIDLPNIHQGERFAIFGRYAQLAPFTMRITGVSAGRNVDFTFTRDLSQAPLMEEQLARDWAFWKLHNLYSEMLRRGDTPELRREIDALRRKYKLKTLY